MFYFGLRENQKLIVIISVLFLTISLCLQTKDYFDSLEPYTIKYEYVNIKDMAQAKVATKTDNSNRFDNILSNLISQSTLEEVSLSQNMEAIELTQTSDSPAANSDVPRQIWYLPTEVGRVTQYPQYGHVAYDITSYRGYAETIHPVANGVVSGIFTDNAGALIVSVLHEVDGIRYTSLYVHLSSYADGLYVGKPVTINDALGQMGSTGNSTGVHLHISVLDCALFDPNDPHCPDINSWYHYDKQRLSENFYGLGVLVYVPDVWYNR